jgi:hypothetical protein
MRQIDVSIRGAIGPISILIAVDCKDHRRRVKITYIDACSGLFQDVGANKGVIVARNGFDAGATARAKSLGIDLYSFIDSDDPRIRGLRPTLPVVVACFELDEVEWTFNFLDGQLPAGISDTAVIANAAGEAQGRPVDILLSAWNDGRLMPGSSFEDRVESPDAAWKVPNVDVATGIVDTPTGLRPVRVTCSLTVSRRLMYLDLPFSTVRALLKEPEAAGLQVTATTLLNIGEAANQAVREGTEIPDFSALAVRPMILALTARKPVTPP